MSVIHRIRMGWLVLLSTLAILATGVVAAQDYVIQIGDTLDVSVLEDPALSRSVLVRPDGKITMPLAGALDAAGRTPEALQVAIRRALSRDFVTPPTVTVALTRVGEAGQATELSQIITVYVIGQVAAPGRLDLVGPVDVLQTLAAAGGPSPFAATQRIQIRRVAEGAQQVMLFDYDLVEDGAAPLALTQMRSGDVIVVPERGLFE